MAYISEINFLVSKSSVKVNGTCEPFTNLNLNFGTSHPFIYPVHSRTDEATEALTGFAFTQNTEAPPKGFTKIDQDLNEGSGTGSKANYLWYTTDASVGSPITEIDFKEFDTASTETMIDHMKRFPSNLNADNMPVGKFIYLLYK